MPTGWVLPSTDLIQGNFLKSYTPSPHDSKFAVDLLQALQNHTALTSLQKVFIASTLFPLPYSWKLSFFSFLATPLVGPTFTVLILLAILLIAIFLIRKFGHHWLIKKEPLVFLELTFPSMTSKSAYATEQLFTLLHTLARQRKFLHQILGHKKQYALEIVATKEEGIRYILAASVDEASIIEKSLLSFLPGIKIKEIKDYLPSDLISKDKKSAKDKKFKIIELKMSNDYALPLAESKALEEHDPIAYLTGNMTKLKSDELMVFQAIVTPLTRSGHGSVFRHLDEIQKRIYQNRTLTDKLFANPWQKAIEVPWAILTFTARAISAILNFILDMIVALWEPPQKYEPPVQSIKDPRAEILNPYEQELQEQVKKKISQPLFETSLRLFIQSKDSQQTELRISGFLASLGSLGSAYQAIVSKAKDLISLFQSPLSAFSTREVSLTGNPILSASELTDIYHFPYTDTTKTEDLVKSKNQPLPAPLSFKQTSTKFDNVFAQNSYGGTETAIGQTLEERRRHTYILGATGSGKTTLLSSMIYNDIVNGKGVAVLDPHGQLVESLLRVIPKNRIKDVVWFAPDDDGFPIALNLLELPDTKTLTGSQLQKQKSLITSSIMSIIQKFYDAKFFGPRMEYILRNTILTALETPEPTLQTILDILTKTQYRKQIVSSLKNKTLQDYWIYEFEKLGTLQKNTMISPITNKIGGLLSSPINYNILKQHKSKIDFNEIMDSGKILLCDLSKGKIGEDESSFFGSLVISKIQLAALKRVLIPEEKRRDFYLYVDEFQNFATPTFSELVSEARKYHLATILAHQSISQIEDKSIIKVILANVGTVICFKTANPEDEQFILPIFSPEVLKHEIANLPLYNFYMKISVGQAQDTFLAQADNFTVIGSDKTEKAVIDQSRKRYATPIEVEKEPRIEPKVEEVKETKKAKPTAKKQLKKPVEAPETEPEVEGYLP
jgi:hypothetical protein